MFVHGSSHGHADLAFDEKGIANAYLESSNGDGVQILDRRENNLSRSLTQRHIQMIALAGAIVGEFLSSPARMMKACLSRLGVFTTKIPGQRLIAF
jgi:amino acid permease